MEYQALEKAEVGDEGSDKGIHLMEFEDECMKKAHGGELFVLRRALSGPKIANREEQRENIFHTRCTINSRVCSLIVDGGSYVNVASNTLWRNSNSRSSPTDIHNSFSGLTKVKISKFLLVAWWLCQLVKVIRMGCGETSFP